MRFIEFLCSASGLWILGALATINVFLVARWWPPKARGLEQRFAGEPVTWHELDVRRKAAKQAMSFVGIFSFVFGLAGLVLALVIYVRMPGSWGAVFAGALESVFTISGVMLIALAGQGYFWRRYHLACPHCQTPFRGIFGQESMTSGRCMHCGGAIVREEEIAAEAKLGPEQNRIASSRAVHAHPRSRLLLWTCRLLLYCWFWAAMTLVGMLVAGIFHWVPLVIVSMVAFLPAAFLYVCLAFFFRCPTCNCFILFQCDPSAISRAHSATKFRSPGVAIDILRRREFVCICCGALTKVDVKKSRVVLTIDTRGPRVLDRR